MSTDRDAQPDRPFAHSGGARPVPAVSLPTEDALLDADQKRIGKSAIAEILDNMRRT